MSCSQVGDLCSQINKKRILKHEYENNANFCFSDNPQLARIFNNDQNRRVTVPPSVVDEFFQDSLELGIPMVRAPVINENGKFKAQTFYVTV